MSAGMFGIFGPSGAPFGTKIYAQTESTDSIEGQFTKKLDEANAAPSSEEAKKLYQEAFSLVKESRELYPQLLAKLFYAYASTISYPQNDHLGYLETAGLMEAALKMYLVTKGIEYDPYSLLDSCFDSTLEFFVFYMHSDSPKVLDENNELKFALDKLQRNLTDDESTSGFICNTLVLMTQAYAQLYVEDRSKKEFLLKLLNVAGQLVDNKENYSSFQNWAKSYIEYLAKI